jgi:prepilin-type N-terminal cleavage/methylation domain-containing protein
MNRTSTAHRSAATGFTLIEFLITLVVMGIAMSGLILVLKTSAMSRTTSMNGIEARQKAAAALEMIEQDVRAAGTSIDAGYATPQPVVAYVDSLELILSGDYSGGVTAPIDTLAYQPAGTPKPFRLTGAYAPPIKYRTGAELVRWTMDLNNNGAVDANDIYIAAEGVDAARSRNPSDYTLVRQVYGDSLNDVANDNGGATSRVSLVLKPGGTVPPLFTVNFKDGTTWDWSSGAVPAAQLKNIASIKIQVTSASGRPDAKRRYARVTLTTTVSILRVSM